MTNEREENLIPPDTAAAPVTEMDAVDVPTPVEEAAPRSSRVRGTLKSLGIGLVFLLILALLLLGVSRIFEPKNNGGVGGLNKAYAAAEAFMGEPDDSIDVMFLGDSETYSAVSPVAIWKRTGISSYTCAVGKQYLIYSKALMEKALEKHHPALVVVEANQLFRDFDEQRVIKSVAKSFFSIFDRHNRWKALTLEDFVATPESTWIDDMKGYRMKWCWRPANASKYMAPDDSVEEIPELTRQVLTEMVEECREAGTQLVIAATPSTANWNMARHNAIMQLADELGVDFIDLNTGEDAVAIDWNTDTRDKGDHLNYYGATKASQALADILSERYNLPDHRGEAGYETWERAVRYYNRRAAAAERWIATLFEPFSTDLRAGLPLEE